MVLTESVNGNIDDDAGDNDANGNDDWAAAWAPPCTDQMPKLVRNSRDKTLTRNYRSLYFHWQILVPAPGKYID